MGPTTRSRSRRGWAVGVFASAACVAASGVAGPAAGLTAIVIAQISQLGFEAFLFAVVLAGLIQIGLGLARAGFIAAFFPSSVIKGLLAAIGVILILKQFPHVFGHDADPEGDMAFQQYDQENAFTELEGKMGRAPTDGYLVTSIIYPSYSLARVPVRDIPSRGESRMPHYADRMTVRQLADLVAFLQDQYTVPPPQPPGPY